MRLLFVCNEYPPTIHGGVGTFTYTLARHLVLNGHEVHIIGFDASITKTKRQDEQGVHVTRLYTPFKNRHYLYWGRYDIAVQLLERQYLSQRVKEYCRKHDIDMVESYDWSGPLWFHPKVPLLVRMHGAHMSYALYEQKKSSRFIGFVEKRNLRLADSLVGVSKHISELTLKAAGLENRSYDVVYNGVDTSIFRELWRIQRTENVVLFAGTVSHRKGIHELFAAIPLVLEKAPTARFVIVGRLPGDQNDQKKTANDLLKEIPASLQQAIVFTGAQPYGEMPVWYNRAACAVFPSLAEAYGLTCAEAMACGTPVVMTSRASGPEIIEDGISGLLREPTDRHGLAEAIITLLTNPSLRQKISTNAMKHVYERFDISKNLQANMSLYERLVNHD